MNMKSIAMAVVAAGAFATVAVVNGDTGSDKVAYPDNYRDWTHVKSMLLEPGHALENPFQGIHHIYANETAMQGLNSGEFKDGSTFVFDLLKYNQQDNAITEGERKLVGVMVKNNGQYSNTGGWGFEGFAGSSKDQRLVNDDGTSCFQCHTARKANGYVFTEWRD